MSAETAAPFIYGVIENISGGVSSWNKVTHHYTGVPMDMSLVDGVVYRTKDGAFYERVVEDGLYNARWWGIFPGGANFSAKAAQAIAAIPVGGTFFIPKGSYSMQSTLSVNKFINIKGQGVNDVGTVLRTPVSATGIRIHPGARHAHFEDFLMHSLGADPADGRLANGSYSTDFNVYQFHGIHCDGVVTMKNLGARNMSGHGFFHEGNIGSPALSDTSHSRVYDCFSYENGGAGFMADGPDANAIKYISCSAFDNKMVGFWDSSFLGNHYYGCMTHYNHMGDFRNDDANARTTVIGAYCEGGSPPSTFTHLATIVGGIMESGVQGGYWTQGTSAAGYIDYGNIRVARVGNEGVITSGLATWEKSPSGSFHYRSANFGPGGSIFGVAMDGEAVQGNHYPDRVAQLGGAYAHRLYLTGKLESGTPGDINAGLAAPPFNNLVFQVADYLKNTAYTAETPTGWRCFQAGTGSAAKFRAEGSGRGLANAKPTLRADDAGWQYFATNENKWYTWTGTAYVAGPTLA